MAGVTSRKGGENHYGIPLYDSIEEAIEKDDSEVSVVYVPAPAIKDAAIEVMDAGMKFMVIMTGARERIK